MVRFAELANRTPCWTRGHRKMLALRMVLTSELTL